MTDANSLDEAEEFRRRPDLATADRALLIATSLLQWARSLAPPPSVKAEKLLPAKDGSRAFHDWTNEGRDSFCRTCGIHWSRANSDDAKTCVPTEQKLPPLNGKGLRWESMIVGEQGGVVDLDGLCLFVAGFSLRQASRIRDALPTCDPYPRSEAKPDASEGDITQPMILKLWAHLREKHGGRELTLKEKASTIETYRFVRAESEAKVRGLEEYDAALKADADALASQLKESESRYTEAVRQWGEDTRRVEALTRKLEFAREWVIEAFAKCGHDKETTAMAWDTGMGTFDLASEEPSRPASGGVR
jgi:hypothetical protein